jgi:lincosamide nucleotidyltransferase A/C/D/E
MTEADLLQLLNLFEDNDIEIHVDGGWGVDALLGEQTREHEDLDIAVQRKDVTKLRELLEDKGYKDVPRNDTSDYNFVSGDDQGHLVDVHVYEFNENGKNIYGIEYPHDSLAGTGTIGGHPVKCIAAEWVVKFHSGYDLKEKDYHDVKLLCQKFNIPLPEEYKK